MIRADCIYLEAGWGLACDSQGRIYDRVRIIFASRLVWGAMFLDLFTRSAPYMLACR